MSYFCTSHSSEDTRFYCKECQRRICDVCVINECKGHRLERAKNETDIRRSALKQKLEMMSQNMKENIESFRMKLASVDENIEKARKRSEKLKTTLDKLCDDTIQELMKCKQEMEKYFETMEVKLQEKEQYAEDSLRKIASMNEEEMQEVDEKLIEGIDLSFLRSPPPAFIESVGKNEEASLKAIFGYVQFGRYEEVVLPGDDPLYLTMCAPQVPPKIPPDKPKRFTTEVLQTYTLDMSLENVLMQNDVVFVSSNSKIFKTKTDKQLQLKELKDINENIRGIAMTTENVTLMTSHMVYKLEKKNSIPKKCKVSNLINPQGLPLACIGNTLDRKSLLLGLKITGEEESLEIRKYAVGGDQLKYEKLELPRDIEISLISHVAENSNGEICVIVREEADSSFFVCFDAEGRLRHRYPTDEKLKRKFFGIGVLKDGMVALIDGGVISGIRFLDQYGCQLHFERRKNVPKCITTDFNDHIWVGFDDGSLEKIQVIKGLSSKP